MIPEKRENLGTNLEMIILCGPSGVGKSTVIRELLKDSRFSYPTPYTDRPLREGETDKISLTQTAFAQMEAEGKFCAVNSLYGFRYGTSRELIEVIVGEGRIAVLDFPSDQLDKLGEWRSRVFTLLPPSEEELRRRLIESGREERIAEAVAQLGKEYENPVINDSVLETVKTILEGI